MKQKFLSLVLVFLMAFSMTIIVSCNGDNPTTSSNSSLVESTYSGDYSVKITAIGSVPISVSKTVQLRTTVTGTTQKDVTWTSSNENIATVNDKGLVTGVGAGQVTITAALVIEPACKADFTLTVEEAAKPTSITISGVSSNVAWVGESQTLSVSVEPSEAAASVSWESTNESVATVDNGLVSFIATGDVTIIATSTVDETITDYVAFNVKNGTFLTSKGSSKWNLEHQADQANAYIDIPTDNSAGYNSVYYAHYTGQRYYIEATFQSYGNTANAWDWQGFGVGSGLSDSDARFFSFSPHHNGQANSYNKIILRDMPETWGALTTRSQIWGEHELNSIVATSQNKIALLRYDNLYYYLINDEVYWYDNTTKYENINTYPILFTYDIPVKVTNYTLISDDTLLQQKLDSAEYNKSFFASNSANVSYLDDTDFTFLSSTTLSKDHKVRSLGDKAKLIGDFEVEFDVENLTFNSEKSCHTGLTVNFTRYDAADVIDTVSLGRSIEQSNDNAIIGRFTKWDYPNSFENPTSIKDWYETKQTVKSDASSLSHVKITRTIVNEKAQFRLFVDGVEYNFDLGKLGDATGAYSTYTGAYLIWVAGEYSTSHISNFTFKSL